MSEMTGHDPFYASAFFLQERRLPTLKTVISMRVVRSAQISQRYVLAGIDINSNWFNLFCRTLIRFFTKAAVCRLL